MGPTEKRIKELAKQGHPLARRIEPVEIPELVEGLQRRLGATPAELDLSPESLKRVEQRLIELHHSIQNDAKKLSEEELLHLVRGLAAYEGEVLVRHAEGKWGQVTQSLWATEIEIDGPWEVIKDTRYISPYPTNFIVGGGAAWAWDTVMSGTKPNLYRLYREAKNKRLRERLPPTERKSK